MIRIHLPQIYRLFIIFKHFKTYRQAQGKEDITSGVRKRELKARAASHSRLSSLPPTVRGWADLFFNPRSWSWAEGLKSSSFKPKVTQFIQILIRKAAATILHQIKHIKVKSQFFVCHKIAVFTAKDSEGRDIKLILGFIRDFTIRGGLGLRTVSIIRYSLSKRFYSKVIPKRTRLKSLLRIDQTERAKFRFQL